MIYYIILKNQTAFQTDYYDRDNCWANDIFMIIDTAGKTEYCTTQASDGLTWKEIEQDHL